MGGSEVTHHLMPSTPLQPQVELRVVSQLAPDLKHLMNMEVRDGDRGQGGQRTRRSEVRVGQRSERGQTEVRGCLLT